MAKKLAALFGHPVDKPAPEADQSRVGGRPWGFPADEWPTKADGEALVFIAQFRLPSLLEKPELVYVFSAQTYDEKTKRCINETFVPASKTTAVRFLADYSSLLTEGPHLEDVTEFEWHEGYCWDFPSVDGMTDEDIELLDEESNQPNHSLTQIGGATRWWQGGSSIKSGLETTFVLSFLGEDLKQLDCYLPGINHVFRQSETPTDGVLEWELD